MTSLVEYIGVYWKWTVIGGGWVKCGIFMRYTVGTGGRVEWFMVVQDMWTVGAYRLGM